jgi:hypothetical protein
MNNTTNKPKLPNYFLKSRPHHLDNKLVTWFSLDRVKVGRSVDFNRTQHHGTVAFVSPCGEIAMISQVNGMVEVEVCELTTLC